MWLLNKCFLLCKRLPWNHTALLEGVGLAPNTTMVHYTQAWVSRMSSESTEHESVHWSAENGVGQPSPLPKQLEAKGQAGLSNLYSAEEQ